MLDRLGEMLSLEFMQRAFLGGVLVGASCAFLSVFVVLRRLAFVSQGVSHAAFGGVALAVLLGANPSLGAMVFSLGTALAIGGVSRRRNWVEDSSIGIFLAVAMALGLLFLGLKQGTTASLYGYLFGSILSILPGDLPWMIALAAAVFILLFVFVKELYFYVFDESMARVAGVPVDFLYFGLLVVLAVTIVVGMKLVGVNSRPPGLAPASLPPKRTAPPTSATASAPPVTPSQTGRFMVDLPPKQLWCFALSSWNRSRSIDFMP